MEWAHWKMQLSGEDASFLIGPCILWYSFQSFISCGTFGDWEWMQVGGLGMECIVVGCWMMYVQMRTDTNLFPNFANLELIARMYHQESIRTWWNGVNQGMQCVGVGLLRRITWYVQLKSAQMRIESNMSVVNCTAVLFFRKCTYISTILESICTLQPDTCHITCIGAYVVRVSVGLKFHTCTYCQFQECCTISLLLCFPQLVDDPSLSHQIYCHCLHNSPNPHHCFFQLLNLEPQTLDNQQITWESWRLLDDQGYIQHGRQCAQYKTQSW